MQITSRLPNLRPQSQLSGAGATDAPAGPQDGFSLKEAASGGMLAVMGRRIPTTWPDILGAKADELKSKLKPGDIILTADLAYPGWARMEFWTVRSNYTHAAFCGDNGNIFEAVGNGVQEVTPESFFEGRLKVAIIRPQGLDSADIKAATDECRKHLGKPYDGTFQTGDDSAFYCSELVAKALKSMPRPLEVPLSSILGKPAVSVDAFLDLPAKTMIHDDQSNYWTNKVGYWPLAASAAGGAALGGWAAGTLAGGLAATGGALAGLGAGLLGSVLLGNKLQTGHYLPSLEELRAGKH